MSKFAANTNQKNISYSDTENCGDPIIFLHGLGNNKFFYEITINSMRDSVYRCISIDYQNHGSSSDQENHSFNHYCSDILDLMVHLKIAKAWFVTSSLSCWLIQEFSRKHPEMIKGIIFLDGGYYNHRDLPNLSTAPITSKPFSNYESLMEFINADLIKLKNQGIYLEKELENFIRIALESCYVNDDGIYRHRTSDDVLNAIIRDLIDFEINLEVFNQYPTMLILSDQNYLPEEVQLFFNGELKKLKDKVKRIVKIKKSDHLLMLTNPNELRDLVIGFLEDIDNLTGAFLK
ncbi:alpha/beta fold hydrolase [Bacillus sp. FJAT-27225]|uniref:alpha/beta fold hydrolase n=1 Tax=Bacillus sp. FJAT-27225 TaxID=1743144 RepID=UPI0008263A42|nr:alpha/beta hydrolase [Bacillus sp. FJAT-27225]